MTAPDPHELGRAIGDLVPDPPVARDRAPSVLRRARRTRRRRALAGTTAAVVAVAGIALGATALGSSSDRPDVAAPTPTPTSTSTPTTVSSVPTVACPPDVPRDSRARVSPDARREALPEGAVVARLCSPNNEYAGPIDLLVTDLDRLVAEVASLPRYRERPCARSLALNGGGSFWIALGYPDGTTRNITGSIGDCDRLVGAGPKRDDATRVWDVYLRLVQRQRATTQPPGGTISCPADGTWTTPLGSLRDAEHAVLTWKSLDNMTGHAACAPIPDADLAVIQADLANPGATYPTGRGCPPRRQIVVLGVNAWGDVGTTYGRCSQFFDEDGNEVDLGPRSYEIIDRLMAAGDRSR